MMPVVNRLENEFQDQIAFIYADAADQSRGQMLFESLRPPGHPSIIIFRTDGSELYRGFGILDENLLKNILQTAQ